MFAAVALIGCNREDVPVSPQEQHAISFDNVSTRAGLSDLQDDGFGVWACVSNKTDSESDAVQYEPLLEDEKVYLQDGNWKYDNTEYWITNSLFYFVATYPKGVFQQYRVKETNQNYTAYYVDITADDDAVDADGTPTIDYLIATNVTDTTVENYATTVPLTFSHLLTKFNLTISQNIDIDSEFEYYVTNVTIEGLNGQCRYMVMPYNGSFLKYWDVENATPMTLGKDYESNPVCLREPDGDGRKSKPLKVWGEDGIMLIPHKITTNGVKIRVDYLYDVNPNDTDLGQEKFIEGYIPAIAWQSNTSINYNIAIANTSFLTFEQPTIEPWGSPQTGGTIIIK